MFHSPQASIQIDVKILLPFLIQLVLIDEHLDLALQLVQVKPEGLDLVMKLEQRLVAEQFFHLRDASVQGLVLRPQFTNCRLLLGDLPARFFIVEQPGISLELEPTRNNNSQNTRNGTVIRPDSEYPRGGFQPMKLHRDPVVRGFSSPRLTDSI